MEGKDDVNEHDWVCLDELSYWCAWPHISITIFGIRTRAWMSLRSSVLTTWSLNTLLLSWIENCAPIRRLTKSAHCHSQPINIRQNLHELRKMKEIIHITLYGSVTCNTDIIRLLCGLWLGPPLETLARVARKFDSRFSDVNLNLVGCLLFTVGKRNVITYLHIMIQIGARRFDLNSDIKQLVTISIWF